MARTRHFVSQFHKFWNEIVGVCIVCGLFHNAHEHTQSAWNIIRRKRSLFSYQNKCARHFSAIQIVWACKGEHTHIQQTLHAASSQCAFGYHTRVCANLMNFEVHFFIAATCEAISIWPFYAFYWRCRTKNYFNNGLEVETIFFFFSNRLTEFLRDSMSKWLR